MNKSFQVSRRSFLQKCALAAAASGLPLWYVQRALEAAETNQTAVPTSANDRLGIAQIGCGGMGMGDVQNASRYGDILAVCDVDDKHLDSAVQRLSRNGKPPAKYTDFRKLLERDDIHVIVQSVPDHWHTLINIAAAKAKKDIYGQKPLTLTIDEGRHVIQAVRDNKIVFQTGTQQRSDRRFHLACELVRNDRIGKLKQVQVYVPAGLRAGPFTTKPVPAELHYDFWLGQAPEAPYYTERCHANFRWWYDYSGGPVTDWGAHHNDIARWGIGQDGPLTISAKVITPAIEGGYTIPSEYEASLTWANGIEQTVNVTKDDSPYGVVINEAGQRNGVRFTGADGWIWVNRDGISASNPDLLKTPLPDNAVKLEVSTNHMGNFIECVRSRKDPIAAVETGHRSACVGHLIIIAMRLGRKLTWDPVKEEFTGEGADEANAMRARTQRAPYNYQMA